MCGLLRLLEVVVHFSASTNTRTHELCNQLRICKLALILPSYRNDVSQWKIAELINSGVAAEGMYCIVSLGVTLSSSVCECVCPPSCSHRVSTAYRISLGGEGNVLYPVLSSFPF